MIVCCDRAWSQSEPGLPADQFAQPVPLPQVAPLAQPVQLEEPTETWKEDLWKGYRDPGVVFLTEPPGPEYWTLDFQCRTICSSNTSYEFGMPATPPEIPVGWAPLSQLNFSLNSCWYGLKLAKETPKWGIQFEWLMAGEYIDGGLTDFDWVPPNSDGSFTHLGILRERFNDGQMLDFEFKYQVFDHPLGLPVEVLPLIGFRWQRFDITAYDGAQLKFENQWLDPVWVNDGDAITFNQQYYIGYLGAQLRGRLELPGLCPIVWTVQGDWGYTEAYAIDHHLVRAGDRYTMDRTHGSSWHTALTVEALVTSRIGLGVQADYLQINTTGTHRLVNEPANVDETWSDGVSVSSCQTWVTAFLRIRM